MTKNKVLSLCLLIFATPSLLCADDFHDAITDSKYPASLNKAYEMVKHDGHCQLDHLLTAMMVHEIDRPNLSPLIKLIINNLKRQGWDINSELPKDEDTRWGFSVQHIAKTAIMFACGQYNSRKAGNLRRRFIPILQIMLEEGADPYATDREGLTIDDHLKPVTEEVKYFTNGNRINNEHTQMLERMQKLENQNRLELKDLVQSYRNKKEAERLKKLEEDL